MQFLGVAAFLNGLGILTFRYYSYRYEQPDAEKAQIYSLNSVIKERQKELNFHIKNSQENMFYCHELNFKSCGSSKPWTVEDLSHKMLLFIATNVHSTYYFMVFLF